MTLKLYERAAGLMWTGRDFCPTVGDMAPQTAKKSRSRATTKASKGGSDTNVVALAPSRAKQLKDRAATETEIPLLDLLQPNPDDYSQRLDERWRDILTSIVNTTDVTVDVIAARAKTVHPRSGLSRAAIYALLAGGDENGRGRDVSMSKLVALAEILGFDPSMWMLPLDEFWAQIRADKPGYRYDWTEFESGDDGPSGGNTSDVEDSVCIRELTAA